MGVSLTVSEINGNFSRKLQIFLHPYAFNAPHWGSSLQIL